MRHDEIVEKEIDVDQPSELSCELHLLGERDLNDFVCDVNLFKKGTELLGSSLMGCNISLICECMKYDSCKI